MREAPSSVSPEAMQDVQEGASVGPAPRKVRQAQIRKALRHPLAPIQQRALCCRRVRLRTRRLVAIGNLWKRRIVRSFKLSLFAHIKMLLFARALCSYTVESVQVVPITFASKCNYCHMLISKSEIIGRHLWANLE